jgi:hypothetical protein
VRRTVAALTVPALMLAAVAVPGAAYAVPAPERITAPSAPEIEAMDIRVRGRAAKPGSTTAITYHNGPVMTATTGINLYYVWYGAWSGSDQTIITDFGRALGGSPWYGINTTYTDAAKKPVVNKVTLAGQATAPFTKGSALSDAQIQSIVSETIGSGALPADANGVYVVLTAAGVTATSGFLTKYCGWHTHASMAAKDIKFSFVGDPTGASLANCAAQTASSPNGSPGVDALISVLAHEIVEAATDPDLNAWFDRSGAENADKCAWTFGTTYKATNGSTANMKLGARDFLIQRNWKAGTNQGCTLA